MSNMRKPTVLATIAAVFVSIIVTGCASDAVTGSAVAPAQFAKGADKGKPFKGHCDLVGTTTSFAFPIATQHLTGTCNLSHLGRTSVDFIETVNVITLVYHSNPVFVAANGDELHTSLSGTATPTTTGFILAGTETTTGGTGRFANASGQSVHTGVVTFTGPVTADVTYHFEGRLIY